ncbi:hypothetical protein OPKNFCMD_4017 [Methylobacterium crusticola]|uniref:Ribosome modulation factor n=1 Tax=Methylobacterium crusticola TaxID=1697972 RepID=A0ABQ4R295_9HYPH|nr:Rmf/CrpP family protein [Methylobacterium crusticola]GJD51264.1 hypothetical protein OPKNFCMD_4017 [Methylobacterium crusticola]
MTDHDHARDPTFEGMRARHLGRHRDACPYPFNSEARARWLEGFDGRVRGDAPDMPRDRGD